MSNLLGLQATKSNIAPNKTEFFQTQSGVLTFKKYLFFNKRQQSHKFMFNKSG